MDYEDNNSYSEDEYSSIYSDDTESEDNFSPYDAEMDSLVNICELHFSHYTPDEISAYICSLNPSILQTLIHGAYDHSQIKHTISYLRLELENFPRPKTNNLNYGKPKLTKYSKTDYLSAAFKFWKNLKPTNKTSQLPATAKEFYPKTLTGKVEPNFHTNRSSTPTTSSFSANQLQQHESPRVSEPNPSHQGYTSLQSLPISAALRPDSPRTFTELLSTKPTSNSSLLANERLVPQPRNLPTTTTAQPATPSTNIYNIIDAKEICQIINKPSPTQLNNPIPSLIRHQIPSPTNINNNPSALQRTQDNLSTHFPPFTQQIFPRFAKKKKKKTRYQSQPTQHQNQCKKQTRTNLISQPSNTTNLTIY